MEEEGKRQRKEGTTMEAGLLDSIISRLLELRQTRLAKQPQVQLSENEIRQLCAVAKEIFLQQPNLLELEAPIKLCDGSRLMGENSIFGNINLMLAGRIIVSSNLYRGSILPYVSFDTEAKILDMVIDVKTDNWWTRSCGAEEISILDRSIFLKVLVLV